MRCPSMFRAAQLSRRQDWIAGLIALAVLMLVSTSALAQQKPDLSLTTTLSAIALVKLFVYAVLLEQALALLFNWRVFLAIFNLRGVKTLIAFLVSGLAVWGLHISALEDLMTSYGAAAPAATDGTIPFTSWLTAAILAGGSSGVNNILLALGFRDRKRLEDAAPAVVKEDKAWLAILVHRKNAVGTINVSVSKLNPPPVMLPEAMAGTMNGAVTQRAFRSLLLRDGDRFPQSGGYVLDAGVAYRVQVTGSDQAGNPIEGLKGDYVFAPRAIIDLEVQM